MSVNRVSLRDLYTAWRRARQGKKPSLDQFMFETDWAGNILDIARRVNRYHWFPMAPTLRIERTPKLREIHAPRFADRVLHWLVVPELGRIFEPRFIYDSFSNRRGKGTHAAVARLREFVRQVHSGLGGGYYLQLDIKNFFPSIHRATLYDMMKPRMERGGMSEPLRRVVHALLTWPIQRTGVNYACSDAERFAVPPHKRLENSPPGCGVAIGNYSSQMFAMIYLDPLDHFIKHTLKVKRYVRYVDDFILLADSVAQLAEWHAKIIEFLRVQLRLELRPAKLEPLTSGLDFLGYVVFPTHTVVRRRVIGHCRDRLATWEREHCKAGRIIATRKAREEIRAVWSSYSGHFSHASSFKVRFDIYRRFEWLAEVVQ